MKVYFSVIAVMGMLFAVRNSNVATTRRIKNTLFWLVWIMLILVTGLRYMVGKDYLHYSYNYIAYMRQPLDITDQLALTLTARLAHWIHDDYATWFFLMAVITYVPVALVLKKESIAVGLSTVFFVFLGCWHGAFNIVKQTAAMGFILWGYQYLRDRRFWPWCVACGVATLFHMTAVFVIPLYFLVGNTISGKKTLMTIVIGIAIAVSYDQLFALMRWMRETEGIGTGNYSTHQLNILRVLVHCAPPVMVTLLMKHYDREDKAFCTLYNMAVLNAVLNVATMQSAYLHRYAAYTLPFGALFIPYLSKPFSKSNRILFWTVMFLLYGAFWAYDLYKGSTTVEFHWIFER